MKKVIIDGSRIHDRMELFCSLKEQLQEEEFQGNNLDALYDVLTGCKERVQVEITCGTELKAALGDYGDRLMRMIRDYQADRNAEE